MKKLGLIGGMSWNSTELYYRAINQHVATTMGGLHSAELLLYSVDFAPIAALQATEDWAAATVKMVEAAQSLQRGGAEAIVICTNTMHRMATDIESATGLPVLHIADALAESMPGIQNAGILGTYYTMSAPFYRDYFCAQHGISLIAPEEAEMREIHRVIYEELCHGQVKEAARHYYVEAVDALKAQGAQAIILGCTEIGMLLSQKDYMALPLLDSTTIHAHYAAEFAMGQQSGKKRVAL